MQDQDSVEYTKVVQSLDDIPPENKYEDLPPPYTRASGEKSSGGDNDDNMAALGPPLIEKSWWPTRIASYYGYWTWGRLCSIFQPSIDKHFSGSEILPGLWIADHASVCDLQALKDRNIKHIICAVLGVQPMFPKKLNYIQLPLRDTTDEDIYRFFDFTADQIHQARQTKEAVLVHCRCGVSRSVSLVCAYLIKYHSLKPDDALHLIQEKRPCANPIRPFRNQLHSFYEKYAKDSE